MVTYALFSPNVASRWYALLEKKTPISVRRCQGGGAKGGTEQVRSFVTFLYGRLPLCSPSSLCSSFQGGPASCSIFPSWSNQLQHEYWNGVLPSSSSLGTLVTLSLQPVEKSSLTLKRYFHDHLGQFHRYDAKNLCPDWQTMNEYLLMKHEGAGVDHTGFAPHYKMEWEWRVWIKVEPKALQGET